MRPQLFVLVVQPDSGIGRTIVSAVTASGHDAQLIAAATWAIGLVRDDPPDVVLLEGRAAGCWKLLEALARAKVPVLVTRFSDVPRESPPPRYEVVAAIIRRAEMAALHGH